MLVGFIAGVFFSKESQDHISLILKLSAQFDFGIKLYQERDFKN